MKTIIPINQNLDGRKLLDVTNHSYWGDAEFVIRLSGRLIVDNNELKAIYGSEKTFNRYIHDRNENNPFKRLGGYALNRTNLNELIFIEVLNCFVPKEYYYLVEQLNSDDLKHTIWIKKRSKDENYNYRIGYKQFELKLNL